MIRKKIENLIGKIDDHVYDKALISAKEIIKTYRIDKNIKTNMVDYLLILIASIKAIQR